MFLKCSCLNEILSPAKGGRMRSEITNFIKANFDADEQALIAYALKQIKFAEKREERPDRIRPR